MTKFKLNTKSSAAQNWLLQRISALIVAGYTLLLIFLFIFGTQLNYESWVTLFRIRPMQIVTTISFFALFYHAWLGMRDIFMDYLKPLAIKIICELFIAIWLLGSAIYSVKIIWSN